MFLKEFSDNAHGIQKLPQILRWFCKPIILWIGQFEGPTEVQLNSWQKTSSLWFENSSKHQAIFIKIIIRFF